MTYLRDRFPLEGTATVFMSGKAIYNLVRWDEPGLIAGVELTAAQADVFRTAVRKARAAAWEEGRRAGLRQCDWEHGAGPWKDMPDTTNPYEDEP
jgi:hypothetical protein